MKHQEILFGQPGQSFFYDPPDGCPACEPAPSVHVIARGMQVEATTGACTIDPVSTALYGDANRGSKTLRVASTDGIVPGGRYLMIKPEGDREWIEVVAIHDTTLVLKHPLLHRYAGAATIVGCRITIAIDPAWLAAKENISEEAPGLAGYLLRWTYTVGAFEMTGISFADVVRLRTEQLVTPGDVEKRFPGWIAGLPPEHRGNQGTDFILEAARAIRLEALGDDHAQRRIRDTRILRELVGARAPLIRLEQDVMHGERRNDELRIAEHRYRASYARLVELPKAMPRTREPAREVVPARPPSKPRIWLKGSVPGVTPRIPKLTND